jgi:hypothetical protein
VSRDPHSVALDSDPRWRRLHGKPWACTSCGGTHAGIFDLACRRPDPWTGPEEYSPNAMLSTSRHFLSEDFCVLNDEDYFVRCVLELPIIGADGARFGYGVWSSLSKKNFELYAEHFDAGHRDGIGPWFGWFSNGLKGYPDTLGLKCRVHPRSGRQRPFIELEPTDHKLALEQRNGITFDRLLEIYALHGHDIRAALLDS